ncbi:hypothetical protein ABZ599_37390 [Streptomyces misionensis]|uniref:hypothetical protein n=1 Tax=Streptomyces misionensis TaxID=67331 RepID=UPI0033F42F6A
MNPDDRLPAADGHEVREDMRAAFHPDGIDPLGFGLDRILGGAEAVIDGRE